MNKDMQYVFAFKTILDRTDIDKPSICNCVPNDTPRHLLLLYTRIVEELLQDYEIEKAFLEKEELCAFILELPKEVEVNHNTSFKELFINDKNTTGQVGATFALSLDPNKHKVKSSTKDLIELFSLLVKEEVDKYN